MRQGDWGEKNARKPRVAIDNFAGKAKREQPYTLVVAYTYSGQHFCFNKPRLCTEMAIIKME